MSAVFAWLAAHKQAFVVSYRIYRSLRTSRLRNQWKGESITDYYRRLALQAARAIK